MRFGFLAFCLGLLLAISPLQAQSLRILALGDSLTAGLGVDPADAFPAKLEAALKEELLRAHAQGLVASVRTTAREAGSEGRDDLIG